MNKNPFSRALKNIKKNSSIKVLSDKRLKLNYTQWSYGQLAVECHNVWAEIVKRECGFKCQWYNCISTDGLSAHHLCSAQIYNLRYNLFNGVALCKKHHLYTAHKNNLWVYYWLPTIRSKDILKKMDEKSKEKNTKHTKRQLIGFYCRLKTQLERTKKNENNNQW